MVLQEVVDRPVSGVYKVSFVLEQMVDALDDIPFSEHKNSKHASCPSTKSLKRYKSEEGQAAL
jgi:hypothetical protein